MRKPRACCPTLQALEERVVLSLSFSKLLHSLFPFVKDKTTVPHPRHVAAHVVRPHAGLAHRGASAVAGTGTAAGAAAVAEARRAARRLVMANNAANATTSTSTTTPTDPTAKGSVPVYGPYLGPPGSYHRIPPKIVRAARQTA
jgi:hypothetical protein